MKVAIVDSGGANIGSVVYAFERLGCEAALTADPAVISAAPRVVLPGVGTAAAAMQTLKANGLDRLIPALRQPVLGICLGMQLLFEASAEGPTACLGVLPGRAERLPHGPGRRIPHMGWNQLEDLQASPLLAGIDAGAYAYFVHSYGVPVGPHAAAVCAHGERFAAAAAKDNFFAVQFHPERSAGLGARLLKNFLAVEA